MALAMQAEQMQKQEGANVNVTAIHGNFDDAQQFLKRLFVDADTAKEVAEKGVNVLQCELHQHRSFGTASGILCECLC